jgi:hypothetical protein
MLHNRTRFIIDNALFSTKSRRNLWSFKDTRLNEYHIETANDNSIEYLYFVSNVFTEKQILEKLPVLSSGLYYTNISTIKVNKIMNQKFNEPNNFIIWHDRLGHLGSIMMWRIIENLHGHPLKNQKIIQFKEFSCAACSQNKLIIIPSPTKVGAKSPRFLERIQGDIYGPIHLPCGSFRYFMVLVDAFIRWLHGVYYQLVTWYLRDYLLKLLDYEHIFYII